MHRRSIEVTGTSRNSDSRWIAAPSRHSGRYVLGAARYVGKDGTGPGAALEPAYLSDILAHVEGRAHAIGVKRDETDWRILDELQRDGRLSYNELGRRVSLSAPSVAERVRRLESSGVITGYRAVVDPAQAGQPMSAFVQMRCNPDRCLLKTTQASDYPEIVEIDKLSGDYCSMLRVRVSSMSHLESFLERIGRHGPARSSVVLSTQFEGRPVEPRPENSDEVTGSSGWAGPSAQASGAISSSRGKYVR